MFGITSSLFVKLKQSKIQISIRIFHRVRHNENRQIFYVKLTKNERAILLYTRDDNVLDMRSVTVPKSHQGRGLARLLAESAFTYAIIHNYFLILSCKYMQKVFLANRTKELEERVVGPVNILQESERGHFDPGSVDDLPDPEENGS